MKRNKINITLILLLILLVVSNSCSTKKKTYVSKKYHDITAKYNGYFNGKESLKYGIIKLDQASYFVNKVPIHLNWEDIGLVNLATLISCILMLIVPSMVVARLSPVKSLKFS